MSKINIKNLSKSYGNNVVLNGISLDINSGEFLVLVGPSGCGKSTTLRLLAGLETIGGGEILIDNVRVNDIDPSKRDIAMVFQNYALYPQMTVRENMAFGLKIRKYSTKEIDKRVFDASEILKINNLLDRKPKELSGGQRQRVALGRAIVRKPKVFLFDEPLSNLDAKLRQEMRIEIKKLHSILDATMIYVTHDQVEAMTMGDRIVVMNEGHIEQIDTPECMYKNPKNIFTSSFIGTPQINLFDGELSRDGERWWFTSNQIRLIVPKSHYQVSRLKKGKVVFGIRAEDIFSNIRGNQSDNQNTLNSRVNFVEYLGSELNVHLESNSNTFTASFNKQISSDHDDLIKLGKDIPITFNVNSGHFFNTDNEQII